MALDPCCACGQPTRWPRRPRIRGSVRVKRTARGPRLLGPVCSMCASSWTPFDGVDQVDVEFTSFPERDRIALKS